MPSHANPAPNQLYYGDNLAVLRDSSRSPVGVSRSPESRRRFFPRKTALRRTTRLRTTGERLYIPSASVDLIYLDPPFNSRQDYNVLFAEKDGARSASQITAFKDTWEWNQESARAYEEIIETQGVNSLEAGGRVAEAMRAFHILLGGTDMLAYRTLLGGTDMLAHLAMMAPRLIELRRVLKDTGSIYLHRDPTASHYLKLLTM